MLMRYVKIVSSSLHNYVPKTIINKPYISFRAKSFYRLATHRFC